MILRGVFEGVEVCVEKWDGGSYPEHRVTSQQKVGAVPKRTECFLECENGQEFRVVIRVPPGWEGGDISSKIYIDGRKIACALMWKTDSKYVQKELTEQTESGVVNKRLCFGDMPLTEDVAAATTSAKNLQELGTISIDMSEGVIGRRTGLGDAKIAQQLTVHEGTKKGMLGSIVMGGVTSAWKAPRKWEFKPVRENSADHRIVFKYRSRQLLMASRVIEMPASPPGAEDRKRKRSVEEERDTGVEANVEDDVHPPAKKIRGGERKEKKKELAAELKALKLGENLKSGSKELARGGSGVHNAPIDLTEE